MWFLLCLTVKGWWLKYCKSYYLVSYKVEKEKCALQNSALNERTTLDIWKPYFDYFYCCVL